MNHLKHIAGHGTSICDSELRIVRVGWFMAAVYSRLMSFTMSLRSITLEPQRHYCHCIIRM